MDNRHIDITSEGAEDLKKALSLFKPPGDKVAAFSTDKDGKRLIFYWHEHQQATKFPFQMDLDRAADFAAGWLDQVDYGPQPDHDGDNEKGWRVYCEDCGYIKDIPYAFAAIEPAWAMHGK